jgi:hypothetical protein
VHRAAARSLAARAAATSGVDAYEQRPDFRSALSTG